MAARWSRLLTEAIDPILADTPFQSGQTGEPLSMDDLPGWTPRPGASVTWCGSHAEVIAAYPHLAYPGLEPEPFWCFDLIVEIDGDGRLVNPALEHWDLETAFEAMGRTQDASAAAALPGSPAEAAVPELAALLTRLFTSPDPPPAWT